MSEQDMHDPLKEIWLGQDIHKYNIDDIVKQAKSQRSKQRLYIVLDILSLSPCALFFLIDKEFSFAFYLFVALVFACGNIMVAYFVKLRWIAAFGKVSDTNKYITTLIQQYKNNVLIARINKHMGWLSIIIALVTSIVVLISQDASLQEWLTKLSLVLGFVCSFGLVWCVWAHKRQKRFERKVQALQSILA